MLRSHRAATDTASRIPAARTKPPTKSNPWRPHPPIVRLLWPCAWRSSIMCDDERTFRSFDSFDSFPFRSRASITCHKKRGTARSSPSLAGLCVWKYFFCCWFRGHCSCFARFLTSKQSVCLASEGLVPIGCCRRARRVGSAPNKPAA